MSDRSASGRYMPDSPSGGPPWSLREAVQRPKDAQAVNDIVGTAVIIAALGALSVGSAAQGEQASLLADYAAFLSGSSNPRVQQTSGVLAQESTAVAQGAGYQATALASALAAVAPESNAAAGQVEISDQTLEKALSAGSEFDWNSMLAVLGQAAVAALQGAIVGGGYGALAAAALSLMESAIQGEFQAGAVEGGVPDVAAPGPAASNHGDLGAPLAVPSGAASITLRPGTGAAPGGVLVGAQTTP